MLTNLLVRTQTRCILQAIIALAGICYCNTKACGTEGYYLLQKSKYLGQADIYLTPKAVKLAFKSSGCTVIMKAPKWDVEVINDLSHLCLEVKNELWKGSFGTKLSAFDITIPKTFETGKTFYTKEFGLNEDVVMLYSPVLETENPYTKHFKSILVPGQRLVFEVKTTKDFHLPERPLHVLQKLFQIPLSNEYPISCRIHEGAKWHPYYQTISIKQAKFADADFEKSSKNFKRANDETSVFMCQYERI